MFLVLSKILVFRKLVEVLKKFKLSLILKLAYVFMKKLYLILIDLLDLNNKEIF
jgi:hypothetical protein